LTDATRAVHAAFESVLGIDSVTGQNFFSLGGDSMSALEIATLVEDELGVEFPLVELFATGDIDAVAATVAARLG
jgi:acyl carrier protein